MDLRAPKPAPICEPITGMIPFQTRCSDSCRITPTINTKKPVCLLAFLALTVLHLDVRAQDPVAPTRMVPANLVGVSFEPFAGLTGWEMDEYTHGIELGYGIGAKLGYGISQIVSVYISYDGAHIIPRNTHQYLLRHVDAGVQYHFPVPAHFNYRYYIEASFGLRSVELETEDGLLNASGPGFAMGGGFKYFFLRNIAIDFGAKYSLNRLDDIKLDTQDREASLTATTLRVRCGLLLFIDR